MDTAGILAKLKSTGLEVDQAAGGQLRWRASCWVGNCLLGALASYKGSAAASQRQCRSPAAPCVGRLHCSGCVNLGPKPAAGAAIRLGALSRQAARAACTSYCAFTLTLKLAPAVEDIVARVAREVAAAAAGQAPAEQERGGIYNTKDEEQMAALNEWRREMEASGCRLVLREATGVWASWAGSFDAKAGEQAAER